MVLNLYAPLPAAFGATDRAQASLFAVLAHIALATAQERTDNIERADNLVIALRTRELIGQAQGILIERERITADQAFDVLRRASQHMNIKLRTVAETLIETGETPDTGPRTPTEPKPSSTPTSAGSSASEASRNGLWARPPTSGTSVRPRQSVTGGPSVGRRGGSCSFCRCAHAVVGGISR